MRVFQLNTFCGIKSTGRITTDIALLLEKRGDACRIGYGAEQAPHEVERFAYKIGGRGERKLHGAIRKLLDGEGYGSQLGTLALIRELKRFQPDVVHLHNVHGCYLNIRLLFRYLGRSGVPLVWTFHDCWPFTGHCAYFDYAGCGKWKTRCHVCPQLRSYPACIGVDGSARNYRRKRKWFAGLRNLSIVTPCHWLKGKVEDSFLKEHPVRVITNGVNRQVFRPVDGTGLRDRHGITAKHVVLAVAAEWDERKGLRYLLETANELGEEYQVVALGLSKAQIAALPTYVLGLEATGSVEELAMWYSLADCLANPTMEDNMPMVNLEALACGTPVAVFQTGGCVEAIDDTCGITVPQGDAIALAAAIRALAPQKPAMTEACTARAALLFDSETCYQQYLTLYRECITKE